MWKHYVVTQDVQDIKRNALHKKQRMRDFIQKKIYLYVHFDE